MHNIGSHLTKRSKISSNKEAFVEFEKHRRFTFLALNRRCNKTANALLSLGVNPGDRVATLCKNGIEFVESYFALAKIGAVMVPVNWRLVANEANYILSDAGATVLLFDTDFNQLVGQVKDKNHSLEHYVSIGENSPNYASDYDELAEKSADNEPAIGGGDDDLLFIMYTSGTTGHPKGVMHSHNNMLWAEFTSLVTSDMQNEDRFLMPMPMFHVGTLIPVSQLVHRGATGVIMRELELPQMFKAIEQEKITITMSVPALLQFMLMTPEFEKTDMSSIRWIATGAAPVPVSLLNEYEQLGIMIYQAYGLTESCGPGTLLLPGDGEGKVGSCGKPQMHTEARVVRDNGEDVATDGEEIGELILAGKHMMLGYWNNPGATSEALKDGWLHTGDLCTIDADGFITIRDRKKDMIISGGENIYPAELENILAACNEVQEAAVIGVKSVKWGETPLAIVVAAPGQNPTSESLIVYCKENLAGYKVPQLFKFVDNLPRNPSGKLLKPALREQYNDPAPF
jgi:acyl-CoA synthetase (AMP-forming)/AMP-acid ligase II